jgi:glyoxylase-like metal-dependent hydrolase (beta-lactamase superfamily II)
MTAWICVTCGNQQADTPSPPPDCAVCLDERQWVNYAGQSWTTMGELAASRRNQVREEEPGLTGIGSVPGFAIGQRALLVQTAGGNVLWDCISLLDAPTIEAVRALGGIDAICMSHPHFYGSCIEWADEFGATVLIPEADREWLLRPSPRVRYWGGDVIEPVPGLSLVRVGGHFDGSAILHWPGGAGGLGAIFVGDSLTVVPDRSWVSFMRSYPNLIPLDPATIRDMVARVGAYRYDRVYGGWWDRVVFTDGSGAVQRSADRYIQWTEGGADGAAH